jgi:predicted TIM-barrel enzyme
LLFLGIQILAGANKSSLAVALASGASFVRCEGFVFTSVADEGIMNSDAGYVKIEIKKRNIINQFKFLIENYFGIDILLVRIIFVCLLM